MLPTLVPEDAQDPFLGLEFLSDDSPTESVCSRVVDTSFLDNVSSSVSLAVHR